MSHVGLCFLCSLVVVFPLSVLSCHRQDFPKYSCSVQRYIKHVSESGQFYCIFGVLTPVWGHLVFSLRAVNARYLLLIFDSSWSAHVGTDHHGQSYLILQSRVTSHNRDQTTMNDITSGGLPSGYIDVDVTAMTSYCLRPIKN